MGRGLLSLGVDGVAPRVRGAGDLYGRKVVVQSAIVVFLVASVLCGIAQDIGELIAFRSPARERSHGYRPRDG